MEQLLPPGYFHVLFEIRRVDIEDLLIFSLRTGVEKDVLLRVEHDLALIVEVSLDQLVVQSEHYTLIIFHPFLDIHKGQVLGFNWGCLTAASLKILPEVLHQGDLFRQFFVVRAICYSESSQSLAIFILVSHVIDSSE